MGLLDLRDNGNGRAERGEGLAQVLDILRALHEGKGDVINLRLHREAEVLAILFCERRKGIERPWHVYPLPRLKPATDLYFDLQGVRGFSQHREARRPSSSRMRCPTARSSTMASWFTASRPLLGRWRPYLPP